MNSNQKTVLVTGATANIGSQVVKQLSSIPGRNIRVRAAVRSINNSTSKKKGEGVELVELDYTKPASLDKAFNNIEKLFLSGINGSSGNTTKPSASTSSNHTFDVNFAVLPPEINSIAPCHSAK